MSDLKTMSFSVQEDDIKKFKGYAEANDLNQAEMVAALVNAFDLARVKVQIFNKTKDEKSKLLYELMDYENSFI